MKDPDAATEIGRLQLVEEVPRIVLRRRVTGRVRVSLGTEEATEVVETVRRSRPVEVERVRVDREVETPPPVRQEGTTVIVPVVEERLVLVRRLVVTEEIHLRLLQEEEPVTLTASLRRQKAEVERLPASGEDLIEDPHPKEMRHMQRTLIAMFDSRAEGERAAEALRGLGIGATEVAMHSAEGQRREGGLFGSLFVPDEDRATYDEGVRRGGCVLTARIEDRYLDHAMDAMEAAGAVDLDAREASWRKEGWTGATAAGTSAGMTGTSAPDGAPGNPPGTMLSRGVDKVAGTNISGAHPENERTAYTATGTTAGTAGMGVAATGAAGMDEGAIRLAEERLRVGKREAHAGRVRVRSYVVETPVEEQVHLREERVHVERHALDQPVSGNADELFREKVIEAEEMIEEAVVRKEVRVTGEVVVNKEVEERTETIRDTVRRTEVEVDEDSVANDPARRPGTGKGVA